MRAIAREFRFKASTALVRAGEVIMTRSKTVFAPVAPDGGTLRNSGFVRPPKFGPGRQITIELVYGGAAAAYAIVVHEHPSIFDPPSWKNTTVTFNVGGPGYLSRPMNEAVPTLAREIARTLKVDRWAKGL